MRFSEYYLPTLKEDPTDAEVVSHRLLVRAGMIRNLTSGIYSYLPLGLRCLEKTAQIVREEMNRAGCQEVLLPMVQPADLWKETSRWEHYGKELLRFQDRHNRYFCLGPTHEEVITDLIRGEIRSYRDLPINLYQIQTKFRDEIRPRFGLMRCREFIMKDGYSFDRNEAGANNSYEQMYRAYCKIFDRLGLRYRAVEADTGPIGGSYSHEFMVLADTGEDTVVSCNKCEYAANLEKAAVKAPADDLAHQVCPEAEFVWTKEMHTIEKVSSFLGVPAGKVVKTLLYEADGKPVAALVPGDRELNEVKLTNFLQASELKLATPEQIQEWTGAPVGYSGPVNLQLQTVVADNLLCSEKCWVVGANHEHAHYINVDLSRDANISEYTDLVNALDNDPCPKCSGRLQFYKGIEVGHIFKLGTKYSRAMQALFLDEQGRNKEIIMGCYGIGVSRVVAAAIEQNHDQNGIIFPPPLSPFEVIILILNVNNQDVLQAGEQLYNELREMGIEVLLDDRSLRPGVKFKDADLLGFPMQLIVGDKGLKQNQIEAKARKTGDRINLSREEFLQEFTAWRAKIWQDWNLDLS